MKKNKEILEDEVKTTTSGKGDYNDDDKEEKEPTYISGDDWTLPIEFDRNIKDCDIVLRIRNEDGDIVLTEEKEEGSHTKDMMTIFEVSRRDTAKLKEGEYKRSVTVYDNTTDKRVSTKPECFYVV